MAFSVAHRVGLEDLTALVEAPLVREHAAIGVDGTLQGQIGQHAVKTKFNRELYLRHFLKQGSACVERGEVLNPESAVLRHACQLLGIEISILQGPANDKSVMRKD